MNRAREGNGLVRVAEELLPVLTCSPAAVSTSKMLSPQFISPVRHIKDGFVENTLSKSHLISALHSTNNLKPITYFPSYEIMMDELRDYRFYASDMLHPNQVAIDYIWERFSDVFFGEKTENLNKEIEKINLAVNHKPINPHSVQHRKFLYDTLKKVEQLAIELPKNAFYKEIEYLKYQIHNVH